MKLDFDDLKNEIEVLIKNPEGVCLKKRLNKNLFLLILV